MSTEFPGHDDAALFVTKGTAAPAVAPSAEDGRAPTRRRQIALPQVHHHHHRSHEPQDGRVRVTVRLSTETHHRIKDAAQQADKGLAEIVGEALTNYIARLAPGICGGACRCLAEHENASARNPAA